MQFAAHDQERNYEERPRIVRWGGQVTHIQIDLRVFYLFILLVWGLLNKDIWADNLILYRFE